MLSGVRSHIGQLACRPHCFSIKLAGSVTNHSCNISAINRPLSAIPQHGLRSFSTISPVGYRKVASLLNSSGRTHRYEVDSKEQEQIFTTICRFFSTESSKSELHLHNKDFQQQLMGKYALYVLSKEKRYSAAIKGLGSMEDASGTWLKECNRLYPF